MARKPYSPVASYSLLRDVEKKLQAATSVDEIRKLVTDQGPKIGYKAFCYMLSGKMSAASMKPDEACVEAAKLERTGDIDGALIIYKEIVTVHKDHPIAAMKINH